MIRIVGIVGAILGIIWLYSGLVNIMEVYHLSNTAYNNGVIAATISEIPLGLLFIIYGGKWAINGYGKTPTV